MRTYVEILGGNEVILLFCNKNTLVWRVRRIGLERRITLAKGCLQLFALLFMSHDINTDKRNPGKVMGHNINVACPTKLGNETLSSWAVYYYLCRSAEWILTRLLGLEMGKCDAKIFLLCVLYCIYVTNIFFARVGTLKHIYYRH